MSLPRGRVAAWLAAAVGVIVVSVVVVIATRDSAEPFPGSRGPYPAQAGCGGSSITLPAAATSMPFTLQLPHSALTNEGNISRVLLCASDQVEIDFTTGVILTLGTNHLADPEADWASLAKEYPEFSTGTVNGVSASLADPVKGALGGVDLVENGVRVTVSGNGSIPLADLVSVIESIQPMPSPMASTS